MAELDALDAQIDALENPIAAQADDDGNQIRALEQQLGECGSKRRTLHQMRASVVHTDDKALAGAVITLDEGGNVVIMRELIRPADKAKMVKLPACLPARTVVTPALAARRCTRTASRASSHRIVRWRCRRRGWRDPMSPWWC
jgi:hypothetical protein